MPAIRSDIAMVVFGLSIAAIVGLLVYAFVTHTSAAGVRALLLAVPAAIAARIAWKAMRSSER